LPPFVRGQLRHAVFSVRYELIAYVLYGLIPINVVIIMTIKFTQAACNVSAHPAAVHCFSFPAFVFWRNRLISPERHTDPSQQILWFWNLPEMSEDSLPGQNCLN
jgi:hypothetical protein